MFQVKNLFSELNEAFKTFELNNYPGTIDFITKLLFS